MSLKEHLNKGETIKVLDLFSGIGGFSLGLGMETIAFCEIEPYCQKILKQTWPEVPIYDDIKKLDARKYRGSVDIVCGGFPCQDVSIAGNQAGFEGERTSLYIEMLRIVSECLPRYAVFENVSGLLTGGSGKWFGKFLYDLAAIGYDAEWHCISASYIGAPHHRDRVWIIAYPKKLHSNAVENNGENSTPQTHQSRGDIGQGNSTNSNGERCERKPKIAKLLKQQIESMRSTENEQGRFNLSEPHLYRADDGIPNRAHRIKALGNAVVPQIPECIGRAILEYEQIDKNPSLDDHF